MNKKDVIHNGILFNYKMNVIFFHLLQYRLTWRILYLVSFICGILNNTNESIYKAETDTQTQKTNLWLPGERGERRDKLQEYGINRHKLLYTK